MINLDNKATTIKRKPSISKENRKIVREMRWHIILENNDYETISGSRIIKFKENQVIGKIK